MLKHRPTVLTYRLPILLVQPMSVHKMHIPWLVRQSPHLALEQVEPLLGGQFLVVVFLMQFRQLPLHYLAFVSRVERDVIFGYCSSNVIIDHVEGFTP